MAVVPLTLTISLCLVFTFVVFFLCGFLFFSGFFLVRKFELIFFKVSGSHWLLLKQRG